MPYDPPYSLEVLKKKYPYLLKDPVHRWRAETGIELIHREPTKAELERIWANWQQMTPEQKARSEKAAKRFHGMTNEEMYRQSLPSYETLFHGSPKKLKILVPKNLHGDPDVASAVFATPSREFALPYAGNKWGDRDVNQSTQIKDGVRKVTLQEMRPGAFKDIFDGKKGYMYTVPKEPFKPPAHKKPSTWEVVSEKPVEPVKVEEISDVGAELRRAGVLMLPYNYKDTLEVLRRRDERASQMSPEKRRGYYKWWLEKAPSEIVPELKRRFEKVAMKVKLVDGGAVKTQHDMDFVEGGHHGRYKFIPKGEIWIDRHLDQTQRPFVEQHERLEKVLMDRGMSYNKAHNKANKFEKSLRMQKMEGKPMNKAAFFLGFLSELNKLANGLSPLLEPNVVSLSEPLDPFANIGKRVVHGGARTQEPIRKVKVQARKSQFYPKGKVAIASLLGGAMEFAHKKRPYTTRHETAGRGIVEGATYRG